MQKWWAGFSMRFMAQATDSIRAASLLSKLCAKVQACGRTDWRDTPQTARLTHPSSKVYTEGGV